MEDEVRRADYQDYTDLKGMLRALSEIARLNVVRVLATATDMTVTDLAQTLPLSQPLVSWHLGVLRRHGLVRKHRLGRKVHYALNIERYRLCLRLLGGVIGEETVLAAVSGPAADTNGTSGTSGAAAGPRRTAPARPMRAVPPPATVRRHAPDSSSRRISEPFPGRHRG